MSQIIEPRNGLAECSGIPQRRAAVPVSTIDETACQGILSG